ncbi:hypothetical protein D5b_00235 [Faustovirus]|nr:hypothetical protein D5b_00235 [Faustovirus]AMN84679.1 ribonucleoside-diphosphate reductase large subunit [Faustovirus]AMP44187.1 hypothetical protein PRJ_Dakar_00231 [Faustovirus]QKE50362.1 hypothetical protein F-VV10_0242 [Faustovirus]
MQQSVQYNSRQAAGAYLAQCLDLECEIVGDCVILQVKSMAPRITSSANRVLKMIGFTGVRNVGESILSRSWDLDANGKEFYEYMTYTYESIYTDRTGEIEEVYDHEAEAIEEILLVTTNIVIRIESFVPSLQFSAFVAIWTLLQTSQQDKVAAQAKYIRDISASADFINVEKCLENANRQIKPVATY